MSATVTRIHDATARASTPRSQPDRARLRDTFRMVRAETERRAAPLSPEDQIVQSMPDASPTKWHRAHTTWFFEQFLLKPYREGYPVFDEHYAYLFNSYYVAAGPRHARPQRGMLTRPDAADIADYRAHVDAAVERLIVECSDETFETVAPLVELGLNHEQQHQELLLTDILHAFAQNPISPAYNANWRPPRNRTRDGYADISEGVRSIGHAEPTFHFDNERPVHRELVGPVRIARALVTNSEWLAFMRDGGYTRPDLWLSDGWTVVNNEQWTAPEYWREIDGDWHALTLCGLRPVDPAAPVCHVSYYEADAFARWAEKCLPSEAEWEVAARSGEIDDAFGVVWQWTRSAYLPYPGYAAPPGAIGEYNGKFMVSQMVLRGSSHATPEGHSRPSYRNFFYPPSRWQFTGLRLAESCA
ncbi:MAG TPA: ergothioneine biosynthesis protein EgtB [Xanthobacteraceae bacterium]|nr:ergothioneine biosynthesis protein EgtB [Xanthobacteraceae bacterium]